MANSRKKGMTGLEIKAELIRRSIKLVDIAKKANVSPPAVSKAISDKYPHKGRKVRPFVAQALGLPVEKIWSEELQKKSR